VIQAVDQIDKKEQLLLAAIKLFAERDYDAVSVRDIAAAAHTNVAMISYYFGSKEKLFEALFLTRFESSHILTRDTLMSDMVPIDKLHLVIDFYVDRITSNRDFHKIISREMSVTSRPMFKELIFKQTGINRSNIKAIIVEGQRKKMFREVDIELTILTLISLVSFIAGSSYHSCQMFNREHEDALYTTQFKTRIKNHLKELLDNHLLIK
jgi:AcrR family transcriptional regulator